jgi:transcription antitermination factor NusG
VNVGDKVKIKYGEFQGSTGIIKTRHMNAVPKEMRDIEAGVTITGRNNETLYTVLLDGDKGIVYFPKSCLELISG